MMSPVAVRSEDVDSMEASIVETRVVVKKEAFSEEAPASAQETKYTNGTRSRAGVTKVDAALQTLGEQSTGQRGVNHKPPHTHEDAPNAKKESRKGNTPRNATGRTSEESVRSNGCKSTESGGRRSHEGNNHRRSTDSQHSTTTETVPQDDSDDQLSQITDILLARLITTLSDSTLGNPALLLQTLLGFSPDDYNDLLAALSESRLSYVDIISAYLHNIRVMSEDSGSTSAALSGTLTRSLIEQYNGLLAHAVKSPQGLARAAMIGDTDGRSHLTDLLQKANTVENKTERRSLESLLPKGPSGLGFGRRNSAESAKQRQQSMLTSENQVTTQSMSDGGFMDFAKMFGNGLKMPDLNTNGSTGLMGQGNSMGGITQQQLTAFLQNSGMMTSGGSYVQTASIPSLPFLPQPHSTMNGMLMTNLNNPYAMPPMQPWTVPMQQQASVTSPMRGSMGWQATSPMGLNPTVSAYRGWGGAGLETVHENFNSQLHHTDPSCLSRGINMQTQHGQP